MRYSARLIHPRSSEAFEQQLIAAGVDPGGIDILRRKRENLIIRVESVTAPAANIIKQQLLSLGGDAAVHRDVIKGQPDKSVVYIIGDHGRLSRLQDKFDKQPFGLDQLGSSIKKLLDKHDNPPRRIELPSGCIDLDGTPKLMGVLNVTPDSFSDGGIYLDPGAACSRAHEMVEEGASIIDIGGESSRPGSSGIDTRAELERVLPVLDRLEGSIPVPISIDTRKSEVAKAAIERGASIINDISGFGHDPAIIETAAESGAAAVVMHMQGTPETMQQNPHYVETLYDVLAWLEEKTGELVSRGIGEDKIIVDPGIGFGKRLDDNLEIINGIADFHSLGYPILVGYSRKSFIGTITGREPGDRVWGGLAVLGRCMQAGVQIIRTHDVKETADFIKVWNAIGQEEAAE